MSAWIYRQLQEFRGDELVVLWQVGFTLHRNEAMGEMFRIVSEHPTEAAARAEVHYLNGGEIEKPITNEKQEKL